MIIKSIIADLLIKLNPLIKLKVNKKLAILITKTNSKIYKLQLYNKVINNLIYN